MTYRTDDYSQGIWHSSFVTENRNALLLAGSVNATRWGPHAPGTVMVTRVEPQVEMPENFVVTKQPCKTIFRVSLSKKEKGNWLTLDIPGKGPTEFRGVDVLDFNKYLPFLEN